jgi:hypothetical protein
VCVLCYEFASEEHWTDALGSDSGTMVALSPGGRHRRTALIAAVLRPYGLTVADPGQGRYVVIGDLKGSSEVAAGLGEVWAAAERLSSRSVDVLDDALLDDLATQIGQRA